MLIYFPLGVLIHGTETNVDIVYMTHSSENVHLNNDFQNLLICYFFSRDQSATMKKIWNSSKHSHQNEENNPPRAKIL